MIYTMRITGIRASEIPAIYHVEASKGAAVIAFTVESARDYFVGQELIVQITPHKADPSKFQSPPISEVFQKELSDAEK